MVITLLFKIKLNLKNRLSLRESEINNVNKSSITKKFFEE
ncbi:protein of unknown function [Clostridium beijerinckii]|nr:protein of unknown function [Clostridium beijerinckii]